MAPVHLTSHTSRTTVRLHNDVRGMVAIVVAASTHVSMGSEQLDVLGTAAYRGVISRRQGHCQSPAVDIRMVHAEAFCSEADVLEGRVSSDHLH
jgi:hypothetical protein